MRRVTTKSPSFPEVVSDTPLLANTGPVWQVLCGDAGHWRCGLYSPEFERLDQIKELERHDCPELFLLVRGQVTVVVQRADGLTAIPLENGRPVLVRGPHSGYCPDGPGSGTAFVVERDAFETEYRMINAWSAIEPA